MDATVSFTKYSINFIRHPHGHIISGAAVERVIASLAQSSRSSPASPADQSFQFRRTMQISAVAAGQAVVADPRDDIMAPA